MRMVFLLVFLVNSIHVVAGPASMEEAIALISSYSEPRKLSAKEHSCVADISPSAMFSFNSGYTEEMNNHPTMYAYIGPSLEKFIVVTGKGFHKIFSLSEYHLAVKNYLALLNARGYITVKNE